MISATLFILTAALLCALAIMIIEQGPARFLFTISAMFFGLSRAWQEARNQYFSAYRDAMDLAPAASRRLVGRAR